MSATVVREDGLPLAYMELWNLALDLSEKLDAAGVEHDVEHMWSLAEQGYGITDGDVPGAGDLAHYQLEN